MTSPIIETNIERILQDTLWDEVKLLSKRIEDLQQEIDCLSARREKLVSIAEAAEIPPPEDMK